jgi:cell division protease FtsH
MLLSAKRMTFASADDRRRTAYHESGHALVGMPTSDADLVPKVSARPPLHLRRG